MTKSMQSKIANIANELDRMPERIEDVKETLDDWKADVEKMVKKNPVRTVVGAFVAGYVISRVARYL